MGRKFGPAAADYLSEALTLTVRSRAISRPGKLDAYIRYYDYLHMPGHNGWLSSDENLNRLIDRYEQGLISMHVTDIADETYLAQVGDNLRRQNLSVGVVDLSNIDMYMSDSSRNSLTQIFGMGGKYVQGSLLPMLDNASFHIAELRGSATYADLIYGRWNNPELKALANLIVEFSHHIVHMPLIRHMTKEYGENPIFNSNAHMAMQNRYLQSARHSITMVDLLGIYLHTLK